MHKFLSFIQFYEFLYIECSITTCVINYPKFYLRESFTEIFSDVTAVTFVVGETNFRLHRYRSVFAPWVRKGYIGTILWYLEWIVHFNARNGMPARTSYEKAVCLSVV